MFRAVVGEKVHFPCLGPCKPVGVVTNASIDFVWGRGRVLQEVVARPTRSHSDQLTMGRDTEPQRPGYLHMYGRHNLGTGFV